MTITVTVVSDARQRDAAFDIRRLVFQEEQGVPAAEEFDADDARATHVLASVDGTAVGTGRILLRVGDAKIGRMAVRPECRRCGVGRAIMEELTRIARGGNVPRLVLHAQVQAIPFYARLGFHVVGDEFEEAGIAHRRMERELA